VRVEHPDVETVEWTTIQSRPAGSLAMTHRALASVGAAAGIRFPPCSLVHNERAIAGGEGDASAPTVRHQGDNRPRRRRPSGGTTRQGNSRDRGRRRSGEYSPKPARVIRSTLAHRVPWRKCLLGGCNFHTSRIRRLVAENQQHSRWGQVKDEVSSTGLAPGTGAAAESAARFVAFPQKGVTRWSQRSVAERGS
jgi:hypothetical protein